MRRRALIVTAALTLLLSLSAAAPANASVFGPPRRQLDFQELLSWASSWFTGLWDADGERGPNLDPDGNPTTGDPLPDPTDPNGPPETDDERGPNLDPDG